MDELYGCDRARSYPRNSGEKDGGGLQQSLFDFLIAETFPIMEVIEET